MTTKTYCGMSCPSAKTIRNRLSVHPSTARRVRGLMDGSISPETSEAGQRWVGQCYHRPSDNELIMCAVDEALGTFGVEAIEGEWIDHYHHNIQAVYCNTGDTYASTVLLCHKRRRFMITSWGDYVERERL